MAFYNALRGVSIGLDVVTAGVVTSGLLRLGDQMINGYRQVVISGEQKQVIVQPIIFCGARVVTFGIDATSKTEYRRVKWYWRPTNFFVKTNDTNTIVFFT